VIFYVDNFNTVLIDPDISVELENNYINASFIDGPVNDDSKMFIATQGPLIHTIETFWRMIFSKNSRLIIMLTNTYEDNRVRFKI
jgi:protein tyrosine phosphatase